MQELRPILEKHLLPEECQWIAQMPFIEDLGELFVYAKENIHQLQNNRDLNERISLLIHQINYRTVHRIENELEQQRFKQLIAKIARILIHHLIKELNETEQQMLINELQKGIEQAEFIHNYNGKELRQLLQLERMIARKIEQVGAKASPLYMEWLVEPLYLENLARLLHEDYGLIKSKAEFVHLFNKEKAKPVRWHPDKLGYLVYLWYALYNAENPLHKKCFRVFDKENKNTKAYFMAAAYWFWDYSEKPFTKSFKKFSSDICQNEDKYERLKADIEGLLQDMCRVRK